MFSCSGAGDARSCVGQDSEALVRNQGSAPLATPVLTSLGTLDRRFCSGNNGASFCDRLGGCIAILLDRVVVGQHLLVLGRGPGEVGPGRREIGTEVIDTGLIVS